jgi:hypothetical protein
MRHALRAVILISMLVGGSGCSLIPEVAHQPTLHNPFPQLSKVAVAPFFNLSAEPTVDGRQFALAYFNELQLIPGYEVVPIGTTEKTIEAYRLQMNNPQDVRKLAQILGVDAVVIGAVTDYTPFYPPRIAMQVEWYAVNPCFHPIPPGYGLPWGTREEELIPAPLVEQAEMALAQAQLRTQTPAYKPLPVPPPTPQPPAPMPPPGPRAMPLPEGDLSAKQSDVKLASATTALDGMTGPDLPENWPDPRAFIPPGPCACAPDCIPSNEPVLKHTSAYNGQDSSLTEALASYYFFQDESRAGGWQSYLQRSDDFIRFCCHLHISEMLSARGGAGESRVVWRWHTDR